MANYIMALDAGTTSNRCILFNEAGEICSMAQKEFNQYFPNPGWVEHDANEIWSTMLGVAVEAMNRIRATAQDIAAIGITNQRETAIVWDKETGEPVCNAIVWQCRRTAPICQELLADKELAAYIQENTGLLVDAYFSATKLKWILDTIPGARQRARQGELLFGTVDTWLIWKLTGGAVHVTDYTNASRTMLYNIRELRWDKRICDALDIPMEMLPEVRGCSEVYGTANIQGVEVPVCGCAGDQQAALFGQTCFEAGEAKNTYGTGCFLLMNTGREARRSANNLLTTVGWHCGDGLRYALEGSVFMAGAVVQWLRDGLQLIREASEIEALAASEPDNGGVFFVPAFAGLGAPYWDQYARGAIVGLTRGVTRGHLARAALEAIALQTLDIMACMEKDSGLPLTALRVDGGASRNNMLMQCQADVLGVPVERPVITETTALGAACLAGLAVGFWAGEDELCSLWKLDRRFEPRMDEERRAALLHQWHRAVKRAAGWIE